MLRPLSRRLFAPTALALLVVPASAQTNETLLHQRLISPMVYELLNSRDANTPEKRIQVIQQACRSNQLSGTDCEPFDKYRRRRY